MDHVSLAIACLQDALDETHRKANKAFFASRFASFGDLNRDEATIRNALAILIHLRPPLPLSSEIDSQSALAS
jgi:predicted nucleotidyltransferase